VAEGRSARFDFDQEAALDSLVESFLRGKGGYELEVTAQTDDRGDGERVTRPLGEALRSEKDGVAHRFRDREAFFPRKLDPLLAFLQPV